METTFSRRQKEAEKMTGSWRRTLLTPGAAANDKMKSCDLRKDSHPGHLAPGPPCPVSSSGVFRLTAVAADRGPPDLRPPTPPERG